MNNNRQPKCDVIIGIDPDVDKNGVAYLDCAKKRIEVSSLRFPDLMDYFQFCLKKEKETGQHFRVVIEAGWMNKGNWHLNPRDTKAIAAAKGRNAGMNHQTGMLIAEMCKQMDIDYVLMRPLVKCWKGKDRKITADELFNFTGLTGRTNQEGRDAALLAWVYAGFSIKMT